MFARRLERCPDAPAFSNPLSIATRNAFSMRKPDLEIWQEKPNSERSLPEKPED
jgi:hypothetical protein